MPGWAPPVRECRALAFFAFGALSEDGTSGMFDSLQDRLGEVFGKLTRRGSLSEGEVSAALREVRIALLEADVALPVVKDFIEAVRGRATGAQVLRSVSPGQMVIKIVHDHLVETLGQEAVPLRVEVTPPAVVMAVGLQGSGKTTSCAKIAKFLKDRPARRCCWPRSTCAARRPSASFRCWPSRPRWPACRSCPASRRWQRQAGAEERPAGGLRRGHPGHRRPPGDRRGADGRGGRGARRHQAA